MHEVADSFTGLTDVKEKADELQAELSGRTDLLGVSLVVNEAKIVRAWIDRLTALESEMDENVFAELCEAIHDQLDDLVFGLQLERNPEDIKRRFESGLAFKEKEGAIPKALSAVENSLANQFQEAA